MSLDALYSLWPVLAAALLGTCVWMGRIWLKQSIDRSVTAKFDRQLEQLKSELRVREAKTEALQNYVLSGRAGRQSLIDKRRIEALERLWRATLELGVFKSAAVNISILKVDALEKALAKNPSLRTAIEVFRGGDHTEQLKDLSGGVERLFVPERCWALYSALKSLLVFCYMKMWAVTQGLPDSEKLFDSSKVEEMVKAALPQYATFVEKHGLNGMVQLIDPLQEALLDSLKQALSGADLDDADIEQSKRVIALAHEVDSISSDEGGLK